MKVPRNFSHALHDQLDSVGHALLTAAVGDPVVVAECAVHQLSNRRGEYTGLIEVNTAPEKSYFFGFSTRPLESPGIQHVVLPELELWVWAHPNDPKLPGLAWASRPEQIQLRYGRGRRLVDLSTVSYRPLRRAVLRARFEEAPHKPGVFREVYFKVFPPDKAADVHARHSLFAEAGFPSTRPVAEPEDGVLALRAGAGESLARIIRSGRPELIDAQAILELLDLLPAKTMQFPPQPSWAQRVDEFLQVAGNAMPDHAREVEELTNRFEHVRPDLRLGPIVPTHGDLYEAHLLVDPNTGQILTVLDIDGAGPGHRVDDLACLIGHLAVLETVDPGYAPHHRIAIQRLWEGFVDQVDAFTLAVRAAAVVVSLIPAVQDSPELARNGSQRLAIARDLLDRAEQVQNEPVEDV